MTDISRVSVRYSHGEHLRVHSIGDASGREVRLDVTSLGTDVTPEKVRMVARDYLTALTVSDDGAGEGTGGQS